MKVTTSFADSIVPASPLRAVAKQMDFEDDPSGGGQSVSYSAAPSISMTPLKAGELRAWSERNVWLFAIIKKIKEDLAGAEWVVQATSPDLAKTVDREVQAALTKLLSSPDPTGEDNSFEELVSRCADDTLVLDNGAAQARYLRGGKINRLRALDGARLVHVTGWHDESDGPRYTYASLASAADPAPLKNLDVVRFVANNATHRTCGLSPVQVLNRILIAEYEDFYSIHILQKNRAPAGLLKMPNSTKETVEKVKDLFLEELAGRSGIGFMDVPADTDFIELGSVDLEKQGAFAFYDMLMRAMATAFRTTTLHMNWLQGVNRSIGDNQSAIDDDGVIAVLRLYQRSINSGVIKRYPGAEGLGFFYTQLMSKDEAVSYATVRSMAGRMANPITMNDIREAAGYPRVENLSPDEQAFWDEMLIQVANGQMAPISLALQLPQYQPALAGVDGHGTPKPLLPDGNGHLAPDYVNPANHGTRGGPR